jgi:hypothetical protein
MRRPISNNQDLVELCLCVVFETELSIKVSDGKRSCYLAKSLLEDWPDVGHTGDVLIPEWLALQKGLI